MAWQFEHCATVAMCVTAGVTVQLLPVLEWQLEHDVAPVWFMLAGAHEVPIAWQLAHVLLVMGAVACALAPVVGLPALGATAFTVLWHPDCVQSVAAVTPLVAWLNVAGRQTVIVWQAEHCAPVLMWVATGDGTVHALEAL